MKAFLEEYGLVIVVVVVLAMLIIVSKFVSAKGETALKDTFDSFTEIGDKTLDDAARKAYDGNGEDITPTPAPTPETK